MSDEAFVETIKQQVDKIRSKACDNEAAHSLENDLRESVLRKIADGEYGAASVFAREALETSSIEFARWCA